MKELEKTKRISIAAVLFILVVIIALLAYKKPKHLYTVNTAQTLEKIISKDYLITLDEVNSENFILIDTRSQFEFEKGHLENAINIYTPEILNSQNSKIFKDLKEENKTVVLYGENPSEVNVPFIFLYQLGYNNIKILNIENTYSQNKLISKNTQIEKSVADINAFINESIKKSAVIPKPKKKKVPKKIIPIKKKKKLPTEGGC